MTVLEIILIIILWVITGLFICNKRDWYVEQGADQMFTCAMATIFAPINLIVTFFKIYLINKWED